jgi:signal transduction histidine kinase
MTGVIALVAALALLTSGVMLSCRRHKPEDGEAEKLMQSVVEVL